MEQIYMINQKIKSQKVINKFIIFINVDNDDRSIKQVDEQKTKLIEKKESLIDEQKTKLIEKEESLQNVSFSFLNMNISFDYSIKNNEQDQNGNELKNPYLKKDDVPELEIVGKNDIIMCDNEKYKIKKYYEEVNKTSNEFLEDEIYNHCGKCKNNISNINEYFCFICRKNICNKCFKECKDKKHSPQKLEEIKDKNIVNEIKTILSNLIIPLKEDETVIKDINEYIDKYIINNDYNNNIDKDFTLTNMKENNEDILLIYQIISKDYINYFHYQNIEKIRTYLKNEYYINTKNNYEGYGKIMFENGEYYIGEFKKGLRNGKGILICKNERLLYFGNFVDNDTKFQGPGTIEYQVFDYYIGEWKDGLTYGKGKLYFKNGTKYFGEFINDKVEGNGKIIWENGHSYVGKWKDNLMHGNGKYIYEDGEYYIGEWKNNFKHGKGIIYYKNGNIKYEGDFINGKREGNGKYIYEDGTYYIGEWINDLEYGNGIIFYKNGNIKYEGDFINDLPKCIIF